MIGSLTKINALRFDNLYPQKNTIAEEADVKINKVDIRKKEYTILEKFYPQVAHYLPMTEKILFRHIMQYRDMNIDILSSPYPSNYPVFKIEDFEIVYKCTHIDINELWKVIREVELPEGVLKKDNFAPFPVIMFLIMRYYKLAKNEQAMELLYYYTAYSIWWSVWTKRFNAGYCNEGIMVYTVNNFSNKFKLKQFSSVDLLLFNSIKDASATYSVRITRGSDTDIWYVIDAYKTKLNNFMGKIYNEYKTNYMNKDTIFKSDTFLDGEGTMRSQTSVSSNVEELAQSFTTSFFSSPPNAKRIAMAAKMEGVSSSELKATLDILHENNMIDDVKLFYSSLFYSYLSSGDPGANVESIKSMKFLAVMSTIFKKGNSMDKNIVTTKNLMNKWLEIGSATYRATNRQATLTSFKKAIYDYFIMSVTNND